MAYFTYDTSVLVSRKLTDFREMPPNFRLSAVVLMEITAGARDKSERKYFEEIFKQYKKKDLLIAPNEDDWLLAAKILFLLTHARRRSQPRKATAVATGRVAASGTRRSDCRQRSKVENTSGHRELV